MSRADILRGLVEVLVDTTIVCQPRNPVTLMRPVAGAAAQPDLTAQSFLLSLVSSSDDAIIGMRPQGRIVFWNSAARDLYGYESTEILGKNVSILMPDLRAQEAEELLAQIALGRTVRAFHTERVRKDGSIIQVSITMAPVLAYDGTLAGVSKIAHDLRVDEGKLKTLSDSERRATEALSTLQMLQSSAPVGLAFVDRDYRIIHINEMLAAVNGSSVTDQIGRTIAEVVPGIWPQVEGIYRAVFEHDETVLNIEVTGEMPGEPGLTHYWLASYYPVHLGAEISGVGVVVVDITERRQAENFRSTVMDQMAEGLLTLDSQGQVTYLNNAAVKMLGWNQEDLSGKSMHELIHFQNEDGTLIREEDSELLKVRLQGRSVRSENDAFTCRDGTLLQVSISAAPLLGEACGHGTVVVFRDVTHERSERARVKRELAALSWVGRIREALDEERLVLYAQPIVSLKGDRSCEELLLRMLGRNNEVIAPGVFLGVAEKYGLIAEIDRWVVRQAINLASKGRRVGANLSADSIVSLDLLDQIEREIQQTHTDPANLVFEITETALMNDIGRGEAFARGVVDLGCGLALDDFGTGYGTFTYLKKLPLTFLKIDIEFVSDLSQSAANQHVVKAIVNLAEGFGCRTIAEGVEDKRTLQLLYELGVDFAQGFYIGIPHPI